MANCDPINTYHMPQITIIETKSFQNQQLPISHACHTT